MKYTSRLIDICYKDNKIINLLKKHKKKGDIKNNLMDINASRK